MCPIILKEIITVQKFLLEKKKPMKCTPLSPIMRLTPTTRPFEVLQRIFKSTSAPLITKKRLIAFKYLSAAKDNKSATAAWYDIS